MKGIVSILVVLTMAGVAFAQPPQVYTPPALDPGVPTFMNAEVVRVDPSGRTITFRSDSRDAVLTVEGEALGGLAKLHPGDQVMLGYRIDSRDGRATRVVTNIRPVAPPAPSAVGTATRSTTIESVRVVAVSPSKRRLTVTDASGSRQVLLVTNDAAKTLRQIRAGEEVVLSYGPGKAGARTVTRIEPVGVSLSGPATQVSASSPVTTSSSSTTGTTTTTTTTTTAPVAIVGQARPPAATGGIPLPPNAPGAPAVLQPVPNVGPPTSPTVNVALPPAGVSADAAREFQAATSVLALKANEIDGLWFAFKDLCLGGTTPSGAATTTGREWFVLLGGNTIQQPTDDACRQRLTDLTRAGELFQQQMAVANDAARKAELLPGTVREILQRNRLDR
jgi:hypothetical protein